MPLLVVLFFARGAVALALFAALFLALLPVGVGVVLLPVAVRADRCRCGRGPSAKSKAAGRSAARVVPPGAGPAGRQVVPISAQGGPPGAGSPEALPVFSCCRPGDPPAAAGPRSGGLAAGGPGRRGRCACLGGSLLCPWPCALARLAAWPLALLPAVGGVLLPAAARADRRRPPGGRGRPGRAGRLQRAGRAGLLRPVPCLLLAGVVPPGAGPAVRQVVPISARVASPGAGRVIRRQLPGLDPVPGLLVVLVVGVAVPVLVFSSLPVALCPGLVRCAVPGPAAGRRRCGSAGSRPCGSPPGSRWSVVALVVLVVGKEQGGRVILGPGCSTWCRDWCRIAGGVAGVRLVRAG